MSHSQGRQLLSPARRHFLAVSAGTVGKATAAIALASSVWSSSAEADSEHAQRWEFGHKRGRGPQCFIKGTHVLTARGDARIEDLQIGDAVETTRGKALPVKWIGRHTYKNNGSSWPKSVMPIRVSRFAIDENTPHRDLYLSPGHGLFIDEFLMPVKDLVNGISVAPALPWGTESIEYFQIVMETHEVIWAEGLPVETFGAKSAYDYRIFANFAEYERLYPDDSHAMTPLVPNLGTGRAHLRALLGVGMSYLIDVRDPLQDAYDRIAARAEKLELVA